MGPLSSGPVERCHVRARLSKLLKIPEARRSINKVRGISSCVAAGCYLNVVAFHGDLHGRILLSILRMCRKSAPLRSGDVQLFFFSLLCLGPFFFGLSPFQNLVSYNFLLLFSYCCRFPIVPFPIVPFPCIFFPIYYTFRRTRLRTLPTCLFSCARFRNG